MKAEATKIIFAALDGNARFVGGAVRDAALGQDAKDIDIATPFLPEEVTKRLESCSIKVVPTGIKHGTVTAITGKGAFEITTLRRDIDCFGRHAEVEFTDSWEEDAARRDFTINAMSCNQDGEIFDYFGGMDDLKNGTLRFVGDAHQRCREDYLRILRFFRFLSYYGKLPVNNNALDACATEAKGIEGLSGERIQAEMFKLFAAPNPLQSLQLMLQNNVMGFVIPGVNEANIEALEKLISLSLEPNDYLLRLAVVLGENIDVANNIIKRWKFSNTEKERLLFLCSKNNRIDANCSEKLAKKLVRVWGNKNFVDICHIAFVQGIDVETYKAMIALGAWKIPEFPLMGKDLKTLGFSEGKEIGAALKSAENFWEENDYNPNKQALMDLLKSKKL